MRFPSGPRATELFSIFPIFYIPLVFLIAAHDQFELPKITFLTLTALGMALFSLKKIHSEGPTPLSIAWMVFLATQVAASLPMTSLSWRTSLLGDYENFNGLATLTVISVLFLFYGRSLTPSLFEKLVFFNGLTALLSSLYALAQHFGWDLVAWNPGSVNPSREFAGLGNPNFLSAYLAMSIPLYLGWCSKERGEFPRSNEWQLLSWSAMAIGLLLLFISGPHLAGRPDLNWSGPVLFLLRAVGLALLAVNLSSILRRKSPGVLAGGFLLILLGLFCTGSRGGFLAALVGVGLWSFLTFRDPQMRLRGRAKMTSLGPFVLGPLVLGGAWLLFAVGHGFLARLAQSLGGIHQSLADSRLPIWGPAWRMALEHPWTGVGLDCFKIAFPAYSGTDFNRTDGLFVSSRMAHDLWLQLASTTGFPGVLSYLAVLAAWAWMGIGRLRSGDPEEKRWVTAGLACGAAYQVQALFSFDVAALDLLWVLSLALVQNRHRQAQPPVSPGPLSAWALAERAFLILFLAVGLYFPVTRFCADLDFARGTAASQALTRLPEDTERSTALAYSDYEIARMKKAVALCPLETKYRLYLGLAYEQRSQIDPSLRQGHLILALGQYRETLRMSPFNSYYYNNLGRVQTSLEAFDPSASEEAEKAYGRCCELDPSNPLFRLNWASALRKLGKEKEAQEQEDRSFGLDPSFTAKFQAQRALDLYRQGKHPEAFDLLKATVEKAPQCPESWYCLGALKLSDGRKKEALGYLLKAKALDPTPDKNPTIQGLDQLIDQAR